MLKITFPLYCITLKCGHGGMVDALDSGSSRGNSVDVRVILAANFTIWSLVDDGTLYCSCRQWRNPS